MSVAVEEKKEVIFGQCEKCKTDVKRSEKRKLKDGKVWHFACYFGFENGKAPAIDPAQIAAGAGLGVLAEMLAPFLINRIERVQHEEVREFVRELMPESITLNITRVDGSKIEIKSAHNLIPKLLNLVQRGMHVYLHGPAGSGKSTGAYQVAEALGRYFGYIALNQQTPESRLIGFIDANGNYRETEFYRCFVNGGVFCIDEMDNGNQGLLATLNGALENGRFAFPIGMRERHKDFICVATGNTSGRGASRVYSERRKFDGALAERFIFLKWDYDKRLESDIVSKINLKAKETWMKYIRKVREFCEKQFPDMIVSPRAAFRGAMLWGDNTFSPAEIAEMVLFKGIDDDTRNSIVSTCGDVPTFEG